MATLISSEIDNPGSLSMFGQRFRRIVEESYEVAILLCNREMEQFSTSKIFDIFAQVFTTAFVLNTGYWVFFKTNNGQSVCVCGRFGIPCRHYKYNGHWIDMEPIAHEYGATVFYPKMYGPIVIQDYEILIQPLPVGTGEYHINIIFNVQYKTIEGGKPRRGKATQKSIQKDAANKIYPLSIFSRFYTMKQYYQSILPVYFEPNPFFDQSYGTLFKKLIDLRAQEFRVYNELSPHIYGINVSQMPFTTFLPCHVNVPVFKFSRHTLVFNQPQIKETRNYMRDKKIQTDDTQQSRFNAEHFKGRYCRQDTTITNSLRNFSSYTASLNPEETGLLMIEGSEEYDKQLPSSGRNRVIERSALMAQCNNTPHPSVKLRPHNNTQYPSVKLEPHNNTQYPPVKLEPHNNTQYPSINLEPHNNTQYPSVKLEPHNNTQYPPVKLEPPNYARKRKISPWYPKQEPYSPTSSESVTLSGRNFPCLVSEIRPSPKETKLNFSKALKTVPAKCVPKSENVFDKNFPPLKPVSTGAMTKSELDEEFEMIEEVLMADLLQTYGNVDCWYENN